MNEGGTVAVEASWEEAPLVDDEPEAPRVREILLAVLVSALLILVGVGGVYFVNLLDQRDVTVSALDRRIADLETANQALAKEIQDLAGERTQLLEGREALARDRDGLVAERTSLIAERGKMSDEINALAAARDSIAAERDRLNGRLGDLDKQLNDLHAKNDESEASVNAAKLESARQGELVKAAEATSQSYRQVVRLDSDIIREYVSFQNSFSQLGNAYSAADPAGFDAAYRRCVDSAGRLESLIRQRERLASQLPN